MTAIRDVVQVGIGESTVLGVEDKNPFQVGFGAVLSGVATYTIEHTFDGVKFFPHSSASGLTESHDDNYAFPVAGIRINITSGTGTVKLRTIQAT